MMRGIYGLITAAIITGWGYFGEPSQVYGRHRSPEERERAFEQSTWICQDCDKVNGVDRTRCRDCGTLRGYKSEKEDDDETGGSDD